MTGALPILDQLNIVSAFFIVTSLAGKSLAPDDAIARSVFGFKGATTSLEFMSWEDCRHAVGAGMTIGSHTRTHPRLADLTATEVTNEMAFSKKEIESQLGQPCLHFCAPYGIAGNDFIQERDSKIALELGYKSFLTGHRGLMQMGSNPMEVQRDQLMANWDIHQLRYFFSRN
jgi:peptidoglycan/xylan/chitin deacetylase (PgdA/CDA1 family)